MHIEMIRTPGLGDATYLVSHEGMGLLIDPQRDVERFLRAAEATGVRNLRYVLETHLHNDYVSGGREAARRADAKLVLPAGAGVAFDHTPAFHLEELAAGPDLAIRPLHTPGHTPEHVSYLLLLDGEPVAVFSGGSLLVASAGRTDLLGRERARALAKLQYGSLHRLAALPDAVGLYPTHGEGSFCAVTGSGRSTSTIGQEKRENAGLAAPDVEAFTETQLADLQPYPAYYAAMGRINLLGPTPMPSVIVPELDPDEVCALAESVCIVDGRRNETFAAGHIPGSIGVELTEPFGTWVGWLLRFNAPLVLVLDEGQDAAEAVTQLARIGFEDVRGVLHSVDGWRAAGYPLRSYAVVRPPEFATVVERGDARQVLDVRSPSEWESGHLARSLHRYLPDLAAQGAPVGLTPSEPVWVGCGSGYRASAAAGFLEQAGFTPVVLIGGGIADVLELAPVEFSA